jgi:hypothetical protein
VPSTGPRGLSVAGAGFPLRPADRRRGRKDVRVRGEPGAAAAALEDPARDAAERAGRASGARRGLGPRAVDVEDDNGAATRGKPPRHLEAKPATYSVWVNTKAHQGELRGALFAGMAHM